MVVTFIYKSTSYFQFIRQNWPYSLNDSNAQSAGAVEYTECISAEGENPPHHNGPGFDTKQCDGEAPVMLGLWKIRSNSSLPLFHVPLWPRVVAPDSILSMGQIEVNCLFMQNWIAWYRTVFDIETVLTLNWIVWNGRVLTFNSV